MVATPVGTEFQVNTFTSGTQFGSAVAVEADGDGDFIITWSSSSFPSQDGDDFGIFAQRYSADGNPEGSEFQVNTFTTSSQFDPAVSADEDGDFIITWSSDGQDGNDRGIFAQRYNADGTPSGSEFQVNTFTTGSQDNPAVAVEGDGDFIITWDSFSISQDDVNEGIFAQRYNADGTPNGSEFQVNTDADNVTTNSLSDPAVAVDGDGDFIITWSNFGQDGNDNGVFAQRYNADGSPNGGEFQVNTNADDETTSSPFTSAVSADDNGDFVVTWSSSRSQANGGSGIFARRYNADGSPNGSQFQVSDRQGDPAVAVEGDGDFVITWSDGEVFAQYYNADGTPDGDELLVDDNGSAPAVAVDENGDFVITWSASNAQNPGDVDIFAQRYSVDGVTGLDLEGGNGEDTLTGEAGDDTISGGNGKDELFGLAGNDIISGDNGPDLLNGGLGNDTLTGGNGPDIFVLAAGEGTDTITDFSSPDSIGLSMGIGFDDLSFAGEDIILTSNSEVLATLTGVDTTTFNSSDFTTV